MKVIMRVRISGTRKPDPDGPTVDWPHVGEELECPDEEGEQLIKNGYALPAPAKAARAIVEPHFEKATVLRPEVATPGPAKKPKSS